MPATADALLDDFFKEIKIQFVGLDFLYQNALDDPKKALAYFYTSPFYESDSLNELLRKGRQVEPDQNGAMFEVTYDNLDIIRPNAPTDSILRQIYFNENAIFHVKKVVRRTTSQGLSRTPVKVFHILQGKVYRPPSFADVLRYRMFNAVRKLEECFDHIQSMQRWSLIEGYSWNAPPNEEDERHVKFLCEQYFDSKVELPDLSKPEMQGPDAPEVSLAHLEFSKIPCDVALRMCQADIKACWAEKAEIEKQRLQLEAGWSEPS